MTQARSAAAALLASAASVQAKTDAARRIADLRARSNTAIAARDVDGVMASSTSDAVMIEGGGGVITGAAALRAAWTAQFADPAWIDYVRTPGEIVVSATGDRAAESGDWIGRFSVGGSETRLNGRYFVHWVSVGENWRVVAETYVTLG